MRKDDAELKAHVRQAIKAARSSDGTIKKLTTKWFRGSTCSDRAQREPGPNAAAGWLAVTPAARPEDACAVDVLFRADGLRPQRLGLADAGGGRHDASPSPRCGFLVGAVIGSLVAWAKLSRQPHRRAPSPTATPPCCAASPTCSSSTCSISAASPSLSSVGAAVRRPSGFVGVPAFAVGALAIGVISGAYQAEVFRGAYSALARGEIEAARSVGMARAAAVPPHHRAAGAALRHPRPRQRLAARAEGIGADLGHRPRRAAAPVADRRRLDPPALLLLHHGRRCSTSSSPPSRPGASSAPRTTRCAACRRA